MLTVARSDLSEHITIWAGATAWEAALLVAQGEEAQRHADLPPPPASSLFPVPKYSLRSLTLGVGCRGRDRGAGARSFTLRELSGFEKINFSQKKFANSFFHCKGESATSK